MKCISENKYPNGNIHISHKLIVRWKILLLIKINVKAQDEKGKKIIMIEKVYRSEMMYTYKRY